MGRCGAARTDGKYAALASGRSVRRLVCILVIARVRMIYAFKLMLLMIDVVDVFADEANVVCISSVAAVSERVRLAVG